MAIVITNERDGWAAHDLRNHRGRHYRAGCGRSSGRGGSAGRVEQQPGPATLGEVVAGLGPLASAGTVAQAAAADMVFLTVMWPDIPAALAGLPPWDGLFAR